MKKYDIKSFSDMINKWEFIVQYKEARYMFFQENDMYCAELLSIKDENLLSEKMRFTLNGQNLLYTEYKKDIKKAKAVEELIINYTLYDGKKLLDALNTNDEIEEYLTFEKKCSEKYWIIGAKTFEDLFWASLSGDEQVELYYKDEFYMISTENVGTRKKHIMKVCLSYQDGNEQEYFKYLQPFDTYEELFKCAKFIDGMPFFDALQKGLIKYKL